MKKYFLLIILLVSALFSSSQGLEDVKKLIILMQFDKAKPEIDKYMADAKNAAKADGWYYKAFIYSSLARVASKPVAESKALNQESYSALKKYAELDPKAPLTKEESNSTLYNLYYSNYDLGVKTYNEKNYPESYELFKNTLDIHDYTVSNNLDGPKGLKFAAHDTDIVWNLAVLANELKKKDEALIYFKKIADADLADEKYADAYDEMIKKYRKEDNKELFTKYLERAKKHYPTDPYWDAVGIEFAVKGLENEELFKKYDELMVSYPSNYQVHFNYAIELNKFVFGTDLKGRDVSAYKKKIPELLIKAISINSTVDANVLLTNHYYNNSFDLTDDAQKIKSTKPEDVKKKNELMAQSKSSLAQCIPVGEEAVKLYAALKTYKASDKANYKQVLDILSTACKQTGDVKKAAEYEKKKAEVDKL